MLSYYHCVNSQVPLHNAMLEQRDAQRLEPLCAEQVFLGSNWGIHSSSFCKQRSHS
jgi:hypothetical protein